LFLQIRCVEQIFKIAINNLPRPDSHFRKWFFAELRESSTIIL
jgi:hypothetical protein